MYTALKRAIDVTGSVAGLLLLSPVLAIVGAAILMSMGRPVFFRQTRAGRAGEPFVLVKFRTMIPAPAGRGARGTDEQRLRRLGRFLRAASLDELPELINVLKGEMSLVGPRPLLPEYLPRYTRDQARRHEVRPGITGWAQVNGRNALTWEERFALDTWYVEHASLGLDLRILAVTIWKALRREGISHPGEATMSEFTGSGAEPRDGRAAGPRGDPAP